MKSKLTFIGLASVIVLSIVLIFALSIEKKNPEMLSTQTPETLDDSIVANMNESITDILQEETIPLEPEPLETLTVSFANVRTLTFWDERIAAGTEGGVFTYRPADSSYQFFYSASGLSEHKVNALLEYNGKLMVGTEGGLAEINPDGIIIDLNFGFEPPVTALAESQGTLLIGTENNGLIAYNDGIAKQMLDIPCITAVVSTPEEIWVSSAGYGLYSFDGTDWKKRYLEADSTAFDYITDLGYKFNRIYAGTSFGLYVFDGGRWSLYNEEDGLLVCDITEVDFSGWKIVVGTSDWGIYEIFEDIVTPKAWSEGLTVTALASNGQLTVLGTPDDGIYIAEGHAIDHINPTPQTYTQPVMALNQ